jgi:hypothetical protein
MKESTGMNKILAWAGIVALVTIPVVVYLKKLRSRSEPVEECTDEDIYSADFETDR